MKKSVMNRPLLPGSPKIEYGSMMADHATVTVSLDEDGDTAAWSRLAVDVFARDWNDDEDLVH